MCKYFTIRVFWGGDSFSFSRYASRASFRNEAWGERSKDC
jgi:hypothetical protein